MPDLTPEMAFWRDETVALSMNKAPEPLTKPMFGFKIPGTPGYQDALEQGRKERHARRSPRYSAGMTLAAFASRHATAQDAEAQTPERLEVDALAAWWHGRGAGK